MCEQRSDKDLCHRSFNSCLMLAPHCASSETRPTVSVISVGMLSVFAKLSGKPQSKTAIKENTRDSWQQWYEMAIVALICYQIPIE